MRSVLRLKNFNNYMEIRVKLIKMQVCWENIQWQGFNLTIIKVIFKDLGIMKMSTTYKSRHFLTDKSRPDSEVIFKKAYKRHPSFICLQDIIICYPKDSPWTLKIFALTREEVEEEEEKEVSRKVETISIVMIVLKIMRVGTILQCMN